MEDIIGFDAIANKDAKILILGSMPGVVSLSEQQYYAHQRNAFWPIMMNLLNATLQADEMDYSERKSILLENNIAVWDVLQSCFREGSLDTAIQMNSINTNNFNHFFSLYSTIKRVFFNGSKAEMIFVKYVLPEIKQQFGYLKYQRLPSTSPAHARMTYQQKLNSWRNAICVDHV